MFRSNFSCKHAGLFELESYDDTQLEVYIYTKKNSNTISLLAVFVGYQKDSSNSSP